MTGLDFGRPDNFPICKDQLSEEIIDGQTWFRVYLNFPLKNKNNDICIGLDGISFDIVDLFRNVYSLSNVQVEIYETLPYSDGLKTIYNVQANSRGNRMLGTEATIKLKYYQLIHTSDQKQNVFDKIRFRLSVVTNVVGVISKYNVTLNQLNEFFMNLAFVRTNIIYPFNSLTRQDINLTQDNMTPNIIDGEEWYKFKLPFPLRLGYFIKVDLMFGTVSGSIGENNRAPLYLECYETYQYPNDTKAIKLMLCVSYNGYTDFSSEGKYNSSGASEDTLSEELVAGKTSYYQLLNDSQQPLRGEFSNLNFRVIIAPNIPKLENQLIIFSANIKLKEILKGRRTKNLIEHEWFNPRQPR